MVSEPPTAQTPSLNPNTPLSQSDERLWAMLAHLSILLNLVTGFLGIVAPIIIYALYKDRSRYVAYQSMQAFVFQLVWWLGGSFLIGFVWAATGILMSGEDSVIQKMAENKAISGPLFTHSRIFKAWFLA